ncbi:MAG: xanthine dehydrogenase family protein subunit M [Thermoanaerobacterales bacterium]|jgi:CO/xanthine dehydrogenase FAD-binding subunit|nr:xanthine dehydrogenase family protein subunit M [Thermoanaerobacterales bacterium]
MKIKEFIRPKNLSEALGILDKYRDKAVILNGGTDIVREISQQKIEPETILYIQDIPELSYIRQDKDYIIFGGATTYSEIEESRICIDLPVLSQAICEIGSPAIRSMGTPAGNIATAAPAADCSVALLALDAFVVLASKAGERTVKVEEIFVDKFKTIIKYNEIIKEIKIPVLEKERKSAFIKFARRKGQDTSQVSVGVSLNIEKNICQDIRISLGAVNPKPIRAYSLEKLMIGSEISDGLAKIKDVFPKEATPRRTYKYLVTNTIIRRAIQKSIGGEQIG